MLLLTTLRNGTFHGVMYDIAQMYLAQAVFALG